MASRNVRTRVKAHPGTLTPTSSWATAPLVAAAATSSGSRISTISPRSLSSPAADGAVTARRRSSSESGRALGILRSRYEDGSASATTSANTSTMYLWATTSTVRPAREAGSSTSRWYAATRSYIACQLSPPGGMPVGEWNASVYPAKPIDFFTRLLLRPL
ncbi:hypothetical protein OHN74_22640 [Streptomyces sp. NBC_00459]